MTVQILGVVIANAEHGRFGTPVSLMRDTTGHWLTKSIRTQLAASATRVVVALGEQADAAIEMITANKDVSQMAPKPTRGISRGGMNPAASSTIDLLDKVQFVQLGGATTPMVAVAAALEVAPTECDIAIVAPLATQRLVAADISAILAHAETAPRNALLRSPGYSHGGFPWAIGSSWWQQIASSADPEEFTGKLHTEA